MRGVLPLGLVLACLAGATEAAGQWAEVRVEENLRAEPNGTIIAQLAPGTRVRVEATEGDWTQVTLEGAVWLASLQARGFGAYDLVVSETGGENLRTEPRGRIAGRLGEGTLLEEVSREPGWARVRRTAWLWTASLQIQEEAASPAPLPEGTGTPPEERVPPDERIPPRMDDPPAPGAPEPETRVRTDPPTAPTARAEGAEGWIRAAPMGQGILTAPDGDTLARALGDTELRVLGREGNWARVQVEGWTWLPGAEGVEAAAGEAVLRDLDPARISAEPERYVGRIVELDLQFISVERAERIRTDFREGEPFLLTRGVEPGRGFVYVALTADRLPEVERLTPLARLRVVGRVRTGAAALTGSPILDLVELQVLR